MVSIWKSIQRYPLTFLHCVLVVCSNHRKHAQKHSLKCLSTPKYPYFDILHVLIAWKLYKLHSMLVMCSNTLKSVHRKQNSVNYIYWNEFRNCFNIKTQKKKLHLHNFWVAGLRGRNSVNSGKSAISNQLLLRSEIFLVALTGQSIHLLLKSLQILYIWNPHWYVIGSLHFSHCCTFYIEPSMNLVTSRVIRRAQWQSDSLGILGLPDQEW